MSSPLRSLVIAAMFFYLIVSSFFRLPKAARIAVLCLLLALWVMGLVLWWRTRSSIAPEERYGIEESAA